MSDAYEHLSPKTIEVIGSDIDTRIAYVREPRWISYSRAKLALDRMKWLLDCPPSPRMPNMLVVGESNNGKSQLLRQFYRLFPADPGRNYSNSMIPVLIMELPAAPDEGRIYDEILSLLNAPFRHNDRVSKKQDMVAYYMNMVGVKMVLMDEMHHIAQATPRKQRECLNAIKLFGTQCQVSIVGAGVKEAMNVMGSDPQLSNRFEPFLLPKWTYSEDFLRLLASFERILPLKERSFLTEEKVAQRLLVLSEGLIGEVAMLLARATEAALREGKESLSYSHIDSAVWATPSERKRVLERWH